MNPYERRIIHYTLQNDPAVETHSEGDEPNRKVIVSMKKGVSYNSGYGRKGGYGNRNGGYNNGRPYQNKKMSTKEFHKKYGGNSKDYSSDYKKDYAAYLEEKAAARAAASENAGE